MQMSMPVMEVLSPSRPLPTVVVATPAKYQFHRSSRFPTTQLMTKRTAHLSRGDVPAAASLLLVRLPSAQKQEVQPWPHAVPVLAADLPHLANYRPHRAHVVADDVCCYS